MNQNIKVSVIVAVYNAEPYLKECMESILNQTLKEIEILCVNDGSTDRSLEILEEYALQDSRIQIYTKRNEGLGGASARNLGLEKAKGTYISILDSDDFFDKEMLKKAYEKAESTQADIVVFAGCEYDEERGNFTKVPSILDETVIPNKEVFSYKDCKNKIYQLTQGMAWNKLYRHSFLKKRNILFQKIKYTDDAYFTFSHMVLAERIAVIKECLCNYRVNTGNSQTDGLAAYPDSAYMPYVTLKNSLVEWGIYKEVEQSFVNCTIAFLRYFYDRIDHFESYRYLHEKYRNEIFKKLDISGHNKDYFYDKRTYIWYKQVVENTAEKLAFQAVRAYGSNSTTGILRFQFPYDKIPQDSKIIIMGAGIMGRHFYAQLLLNSYCDVVLLVENNNKGKFSYIQNYDMLRKVEFDYAVIAYVQKKLINHAIAALKEIGIPNEKIVLGGTVL